MQVHSLPPSYNRFDTVETPAGRLEAWRSPMIVDPYWDDFLRRTPCGQFQQSSLWAEFKAAENWHHYRVILTREAEVVGGWQILWKKKAGLRIGYVSKGPVAHPETVEMMQFLVKLLASAAQRLKLVALIVQAPDETILGSACFQNLGFITSNPMRVVEATWLIDLRTDLETIRGNMTSGRRKNLRKAKSLPTKVIEGDQSNLEAFFTLMAKTCQRQQVSPNPPSAKAFHLLWDIFSRNRSMRLTLANLNGENCAGLVSVGFGDRFTFWKKGWNGEHENHRLSELLEDESLEWSNRQGYRLFDFCSFNRNAAERILAGTPARDLKLSTRDEYHSRYGGRPLLLPQAMILLPNPILRWFYRQTYVRREQRRSAQNSA